eukprot:gene9834-7718_t
MAAGGHIMPWPPDAGGGSLGSCATLAVGKSIRLIRNTKSRSNSLALAAPRIRLYCTWVPLSSVEPCSRVAVRASGKLDDVSLFGSSSSGLSGLSGGAPKVEESKPTLENVELKSTVGMDYSVLRDCLQEQDFRKADDETRALLIKLAGEDAEKRGWVYWSEVKMISDDDFQTMDNLWTVSSNGKFGFSVQKDLFRQNKKRWPKFFKQINWVQGEFTDYRKWPSEFIYSLETTKGHLPLTNGYQGPSASCWLPGAGVGFQVQGEFSDYRKWPSEFIYSMEATKGHLPLTNALRGTQLFTAILEHPAFEKRKAGAKSLDDKAKESNANTSKFF